MRESIESAFAAKSWRTCVAAISVACAFLSGDAPLIFDLARNQMERRVKRVIVFRKAIIFRIGFLGRNILYIMSVPVWRLSHRDAIEA